MAAGPGQRPVAFSFLGGWFSWSPSRVGCHPGWMGSWGRPPCYLGAVGCSELETHAFPPRYPTPAPQGPEGPLGILGSLLSPCTALACSAKGTFNCTDTPLCVELPILTRDFLGPHSASPRPAWGLRPSLRGGPHRWVEISWALALGSAQCRPPGRSGEMQAVGGTQTF